MATIVSESSRLPQAVRDVLAGKVKSTDYFPCIAIGADSAKEIGVLIGKVREILNKEYASIPEKTPAHKALRDRGLEVVRSFEIDVSLVNEQRDAWRKALVEQHKLSEDLFARGTGGEKVVVPAGESIL